MPAAETFADERMAAMAQMTVPEGRFALLARRPSGIS